MAHVEWKRARFENVAHLVINGDVLVLCGAPSRKGPRPVEEFTHAIAAEFVPSMACEECKAIITEAAASLSGGVILTTPVTSSLYNDDEFRDALAADGDTKCRQCEHTKFQHYSAAPRCMFCRCPAFKVERPSLNVVEAHNG
ncbi:MAG TPA: hypothetical protein VGK17_03065 [Propionicimonas sp.]|jgi:hypothetical protein